MVLSKKLTRPLSQLFCLVALVFVGCSERVPSDLIGIWRSQEAYAGKALVLEFKGDGTGSVFSGSIIGFPSDAVFRWEAQSDAVLMEAIETKPIRVTMEIQTLDAANLQAEFNGVELNLVRAEEREKDDATKSLP